ncbi:MAG: hypothetical protein ACRC62_17290 [Microcoleus sp.]
MPSTTPGGFYQDDLALRAVLIQLGHNINEIQQELADLKNTPQPPTMGGHGQLGLFTTSGDRPATPYYARIAHLEILLLNYLKEYSRANTAEVNRRVNSQKYVEVVLLVEEYENLRSEALTIAHNLGGEEKETLMQRLDERFGSLSWLRGS